MRNYNHLKAISSVGLYLAPVLCIGVSFAAPPFVPANTPVVIGYIAQPALTNNSSLLSGNERVFRAEYEKGAWSGNLSCYPISATGVVGVNSPCWTSGTGLTAMAGAQSQVDLQGFTSGSRNIATLGATGKAVSFALTVDPLGLIDQAHVDFIRGDRSQEAPAGAMRTRTSALGDSIHSTPYYLADASSPTVFYGANDGMLHAINAITGAERWAYIPSMLVAKLSKLWKSPYVHEYFVDGSINVTNVGTPASPQKILVGTLGQGGKGIYALDVTSLTAASDTDVANKALWEITPTGIAKGGVISNSTSYANLGDTLSSLTLYPVETGANAVIMGNGYNNTGNGHATLLVIDTKTGALIREVDTGVGSLTSPNGLSSPVAVDSNSNGRADFVYAGDIDGNMWKFDLSSASPGSWSATLLYNTADNPNVVGAQPITMMPGVAKHPNGGYMVTFATGQLFTAADVTDSSIYYVYGVWDSAPSSNTTMVDQVVQIRDYISASGAQPIPVRVVGSTPEGATITTNWAAGGNKGWMTQLPVAGERVTGDIAFIQSGRFFFNATNPLTIYTPAGGASNSGKGENWLMELDFLTGGAPSTPFFDLDGNGSLTANDRIRYIAGDVVTPPNALGTPIMTNFGIPISVPTSNGVQSQPVLGGLGAFSAVFFNQNYNLAGSPGVVVPPGATGVGNGHFDVDSFYNSGSPGYPAACTGGTLSNDGKSCVQGSCTGGTVDNTGKKCATAAADSCVGGGKVDTKNKKCIPTPAIPATGTCTGGILNATFSACTPGPICIVAGKLDKSTSLKNCNKVAGTFYAKGTTPGTFAITSPAVPAGPTGTFVAKGQTLGTWSPLASSGVYTAAIPQSTTNYGTQGSHVHEYDKSYDVNGLNLLNPNDANLTMATAGITSSTPYKVLLMNQSWNRAMFFKVADTTWSTQDYQTGVANQSGSYNTAVSMAGAALGVGALKLSSVPTYTGNTSTVLTTSTDPVSKKVSILTVQTPGTIGGVLGAVGGLRESVGGLEIAMPYDAFSVKDWWGDGSSQTGVMPTSPSCPDASNKNDGTENTNAAGAGKQYVGLLGERNNGVITVQLIKATTPDSAVQLNVPGRPDLGFRVVDNEILTYVLAEYIVYWHHPMDICMGDYASTVGDAGNAWNATNNSKDPWWPAKADKKGWFATAPTGWSITPPPDLATTKPPTPSYSKLADDPRSASFIKASLGTGTTTPGSSTPATVTVTIPGLIGGAASGTGTGGGGGGGAICTAGTPNCACVGTVCTTTSTPCGSAGLAACPGSACTAGTPNCVCVGTVCSVVACGTANAQACQCTGAGCTTSQPCGTVGQPVCLNSNSPPKTGRLSWRELIGN
jgi:Neisseria PilC beta-propeller domain